MANPDRLGRLVRKRIEIPYNVHAGFIGAAGVSVSTGVGDAPEAEASTLSAVGLHMDANDEHDWFWPLPLDLNWLHPIGFRVRYSSASATAADDRQWIVLYDIIAENAAIAIGTTALTTAIAAETDSGVAEGWQYSPRGELAGQTLTKTDVENGHIMAINLELGLDDASEEMNMYSIVIDYVPKRYQGAPYHWNPAVDDHGIGGAL